MEQERSTSGLAADEREPKKSEGLCPTSAAPLSAFSRMTTELQQARLLPVQFESKLFEPRSHRVPEAPRIGFMLETHDQSSHPEEPPLQVPTEPDVSLSTHPALPTPACPHSNRQLRWLRLSEQQNWFAKWGPAVWHR